MKSPSKQFKSKKRVKDFGEVYTQEREVKAMLDLVKEESYRIDSLFLEPACGNGNFLVEILKRKLSVSKAKEDVLTALSSIYAIDILEDNILESKKRLYELVQNDLTQQEAFFIMNQNVVCGDSLELLNTPFYTDMKFDVIIGNPPYQLSVSGNNRRAIPLYHKFVEQALKMNPKYITMIIPSRWFSLPAMKTFRAEMFDENKLEHLVDFLDSSDCFSNVDIKGGVCYFLWNTQHNGPCNVKTINGSIVSEMRRYLSSSDNETFIRYNEAIPILEKVSYFKEESFATIVSKQKPFGLPTNYIASQNPNDGEIKVHAFKKKMYVNRDVVIKNAEWIDLYKLFTPKAVGSGVMGEDRLQPILGVPGDICTETYLVVGVSHDLDEVLNILSYTKTKFFHFMWGLKKITQDALSSSFSLIPMQDFSKPWTDAELYEKYGLTQEEIDYIESMIRPMN